MNILLGASRTQRHGSSRHWNAGASICLQHCESPTSLPPLPLLPSLPLPLEVGPLNPARGSEGALWAPPVGSGAKPQLPTILMHFKGEGTWHSVLQYNLTSDYIFCNVARLLWGSGPADRHGIDAYEFQWNRLITFAVICTHRQTYRQTDSTGCITCVGRGNNWSDESCMLMLSQLVCHYDAH